MFTTSRTPFTALVSIGAWITTSVANSLLKFSSLAPASMATRNGCFDMAYAPLTGVVACPGAPDGNRGGVLWSRWTCLAELAERLHGLLPYLSVGDAQGWGAGGIGSAMSVARRHPSGVRTHSKIMRN